MIGGILANEVVKLLRDEQQWDDSRCSIAPQGQPWPSSGDYFVGVFPNDDTNDLVDYTYGCIRSRHGFTVRISRRLLGTPPDRYHKIYLDETKSLITLANTVRQTLLDKRTTVMANVVAEITQASEDQNLGLIKTYDWLSTDSEITERNSAWFRSDQDDMIRDLFNPAGFSIDIVFGNALGAIEAAQ